MKNKGFGKFLVKSLLKSFFWTHLFSIISVGKGKLQSYIGKAHRERRIVMSGAENSIGVYSGKQVRIVTPDDKVFEGYISET